MKKIEKFKRALSCMVFLLLPFFVQAGDINDAFVLVDVSGSMTDTKTNQEAKSIIQEILVGDFSMSKWQNYGWKLDDSKAQVNKLPTSTILRDGSHFYMVPFGEMNRVKEWSGHTYKDALDFATFYSQRFPTTFNDDWTYLTLAKAYVGSIALSDGVRTAYVIIYTDGKPEATNKPLDEMNQARVDALQAAGNNGLKKNAILRKKVGGDNHFDVEIWEFVNYKTVDTQGKAVDPDTIRINSSNEVHQIRITQPQDGQNVKSSHSLTTNEDLKIVWTGGLASAIVVQKKAGNSWSRIPNAKEVYELKEQGTSAIIKFFESADYKITVRGKEGGSDDLYVNVSTSILSFLLPLLIIILFVVGGVYVYDRFFRKKHPTGPDTWEDNDKKSRKDSSWNNDDDW